MMCRRRNLPSERDLSPWQRCIVCISWMSATPLKCRTCNESCSYAGGNILAYFSYKAWFCSALCQCKAGVTPLKSLVLKRLFQNQSHNAFLQKKKLLTAKPIALPVQLIFSENHGYQFGLNIFMDNYKTLLQSVWLSWQQAISLRTKLWPKYLTYKQENKNSLLPTSEALLTTSVVFCGCTSITSYQVTCKWINEQTTQPESGNRIEMLSIFIHMKRVCTKKDTVVF